MRNRFRPLSTVLGVAAIALSLSAAPASASLESSFVAEINASRAASGLEPLEVYWDLADDAEAHSGAMQAAGEIYHNPNLANVTSGWSALAENVGVGPDVARLHDAFMDSAGHKKNILGNYNYVGIGVVRETETKIWVTVVFMRGPDGLVDPPAEPPPTTQPPAPKPPSTTTQPPDPEPPAAEPAAPTPPVRASRPNEEAIDAVATPAPRPGSLRRLYAI